MAGRFAKWVAIVTGAASGIDAATACALAADGVHVVMVDIAGTGTPDLVPGGNA